MKNLKKNSSLVAILAIGVAFGLVGAPGLWCNRIEERQAFETERREWRDAIGQVYRKIEQFDARDIRLYEKWKGSVGFIEIFKDGVSQGHGSGFLVKYKGKVYVLTAGHVVSDEAVQARMVSIGDGDTWTIKFGDKPDAKVYDLTLVKVHETADCALLTIPDPPTDAFTLGKVPAIGSDCWIIGYPLWFTSLLGKGIISGRDGATYTTDVGIAPGNSGSPVFNEKGEVYGIAVAVPRWQFTVLTHIAICVSVSSASDLFRGLE